MKGYIEPYTGSELKKLTALCKEVESNAANMSEAELAKAITEMNYQTRKFLNVKPIKNK